MGLLKDRSIESWHRIGLARSGCSPPTGRAGIRRPRPTSASCADDTYAGRARERCAIGDRRPSLDRPSDGRPAPEVTPPTSSGPRARAARKRCQSLAESSSPYAWATDLGVVDELQRWPRTKRGRDVRRQRCRPPPVCPWPGRRRRTRQPRCASQYRRPRMPESRVETPLRDNEHLDRKSPEPIVELGRLDRSLGSDRRAHQSRHDAVGRNFEGETTQPRSPRAHPRTLPRRTVAGRRMIVGRARPSLPLGDGRGSVVKVVAASRG